jgi:hypothetical protein
MKKIIALVFLIAVISSCTSRRDLSGSFTIKGQIPDIKGQKVIFAELNVLMVRPLDSLTVSDEGRFSFSGNASQPGFYLLIFQDGERTTLLMKGGETLTVTGSRKKNDLSMQGSEGSELLQNFFRDTQKNWKRIDSVKTRLSKDEGTENFLKTGMVADSIFLVISRDQKTIEKKFIDTHPTSLASLIVLNFAFGPEPVLTLKEDLPYYVKVAGLGRFYPFNRHVLYHIKRVSYYLDKFRSGIN